MITFDKEKNIFIIESDGERVEGNPLTVEELERLAKILESLGKESERQKMWREWILDNFEEWLKGKDV